MNTKTTLVLVVLLALVGAYVFFIGRNTTSTYELEQAERAAGPADGAPLFAEDTFKAADVTRVSITRGGEAAAFEKIDGKWTQVEPARFPADEVKLDGLVTSAAGLRYVDRVTAGGANQPSKKDLALAPARAVVQLTVGEKSHTISVGRKSTGGRGYVTLGDADEVFVVNDALQSVLLTPDALSNWRKKSLAAPAANELDNVTVGHGAERLTLVKRDGRWYLDGDMGGRASDSAVSDLVRSVGYLSAQAFVNDKPETLGNFGLDEPRTVVTLRQTTTGEGETPRLSTLRVGNAADAKGETVYASWTQGEGEVEPSPVVFTVSKANVERLVKRPDDLRDKAIVAVKNAADVVSMTVTPVDGEPVQLQRDGGSWRFADPGPGFGVDTTAANDRLDAVLTAEAERFEPAPEAAAAATITLRIAGRDEPETVTLFPAPGDVAETHWLAVREGETVAAVLPKDRLARVLSPAVVLRDKRVWGLDGGAVASATLEQPRGATYRFTKADGRWALDGAERFESGDLDLLIDEVARLRAESWEADGRAPGDSAITLTLQLPDGTRTLRVDPESRVAQVDGVDDAFLMEHVLVELLAGEYRERTLVELPIDSIGSVKLTRGEQSVTLTRGATGQYSAEGLEGEVDQAQAATVFDTLAGLRVERWMDAPRRDKSAIGMIGVELTPTSGDPRRLTLFTTDDAGIVGEGEATRWFMLDDADVARIVAPIAPEEADKAVPIEADLSK